MKLTIVTGFVLLILCAACISFENKEQAGEQALDSVEVALPASNIAEELPELIGEWENVGMLAGGMLLSADDISRPNRSFTAEGLMIISPLGSKPDTSTFIYENGYLRAGQEGTERIKLLTADSLIIENELDGEAVDFLFVRK
ncbi:MAG: hypothetical protein D6730_04365 [Bacteroidetes bacterium]|nr:MAG: hypothetical protein D6730_04365 [Bacteroidota bacterium]